MSGKRAKMRRFPYIKQNSIAEIVSTMESFLVAEVGFEPHDLRVMSPTSYQAALLRDIDFFRLYRYGAGDRGRTGTILSYHGILSPGRLPVPPHRRLHRRLLPLAYTLYHSIFALSTPFEVIFELFIIYFCILIRFNTSYYFSYNNIAIFEIFYSKSY